MSGSKMPNFMSLWKINAIKSFWAKLFVALRKTTNCGIFCENYVTEIFWV
jgi:hypothetical protein